MKNIRSHYAGNHTFTVTETATEEPGAEDVRIKVAYCGVCGTDVHIYHGMMDQRVSTPLTIGHEMSGIIDKVGAQVTGFSVGDKVVVRPLDDREEQASDKGFSHIAAKLKFIGIDSPGAMQSYWNVPAFVLHKLPADTDMQLAALVEPLAVACHDVRLSGLKAGETAVVLGGGPIGMLVAMVAKETGAQVILSETNPVRVSLAKALGFDVVNPMNDDLVDFVSTKTDGGLADVVFEVAGVQPTIDVMTEVAGLRGRIVLVAIHGQPRPVNLFKFFWKELQLIGARVYEPEDYEYAIQLVAGKSLPLSDLVTSIAPLTDIQSVFKKIDENPDGMKVLLDCQA
ncbi:MAG: alcohol dehydrogenase catalytic domain-containing protein [Bacteroidota bacterium]